MKKVCVVTWFKSPNYGTKLQAAALCCCLEQMGCDVTIMDKFMVWPYFLLHPGILLNRVAVRLHEKERNQFFRPNDYPVSTERKERLDAFVRDVFHPVSIDSEKKWRQIRQENTTFIVGSDILWQPANGWPGKFFLDFVYPTKLECFSYATSAGTKHFPRKNVYFYRKYLGRFEAVSVRERRTANYLSKVTGKDVKTVIDPTLLHGTDFWDKYAARAVFSQEPPKPGSYLLCYFVMNDHRYWEYVAKMAEKTGLEVYVIPMHTEDEALPYRFLQNGTPYEFICLISHAAMVCTDSFHAGVFSFLYHRELYILRRARRDEDDKFDDFTRRYDLTDRIIQDETGFERKTDHDFRRGDRRLEEDRRKARCFIADALHMKNVI